MLGRLFLNLAKDPKNDDGSNDTTDEISDPWIGVNANKAKQPTTNDTTKDTEDEVNDKTITAAALQFASDIACYEANNQWVKHKIKIYVKKYNV